MGGTVSGSSAAGGSITAGTPSPPLLYPPAASGGQVSFIRDISGLATIRRPSWSSRSSSFDIAAAGSTTLPHHLSMSPGMADLMDPNLMLGYSSSHGSSAPGNTLALRALPAGGSGSAAAPAVGYRWNLGGQQQPSAGFGPQRQSQHAQQQQQDGRGGTISTASGGSSGAAEAVPPVIAVGAAAEDGGGSGPAAAAEHAAAGPPSSAAAASGSESAGVGVEEAFGGSMGHEHESESDLLPFVLDESEPTAMQQMMQLQHGHATQALAAAAAAGAGFGRQGPVSTGAGPQATARRAGGAAGATTGEGPGEAGLISGCRLGL